MKFYVQFFLISLVFCSFVRISAATDEELFGTNNAFRTSLVSPEAVAARKTQVAADRGVQSTADALSDEQRSVLSKYGEAPEDKMEKYRIDDLKRVADDLTARNPEGFQSPNAALNEEQRTTLKAHGITFKDGVEFAPTRIQELQAAADRLKGKPRPAGQADVVLDNDPIKWFNIRPTITEKKTRVADETATSKAMLDSLADRSSGASSTPTEFDPKAATPRRILSEDEMKAARQAVGGQLISGVKKRTITTVTARASETASAELIAKYKDLGLNIPEGTQLKKTTIAYLNMPTTIASLSKRPLMASSDITDEAQLKKTINTITAGGVTDAERAELKRYNVKLESSEGGKPVEGDMNDIQKTKKLAEAFNKVKKVAPLKDGESRPEVKIMTAALDPSEFMQRHLDTLTISDEAERTKAAEKRGEEELTKLKQIQAEVAEKETARKAQDEEDKIIKRNLFLEKIKIKRDADAEIARLKRDNSGISDYDLKDQIKAISVRHSKEYVERKKTIVQSVKAQAGEILKSIGFGQKPQTSGAAKGSSKQIQPGRLKKAANFIAKAFKPSSSTKAH